MEKDVVRTSGIVCDLYKVSAFKSALVGAGFKIASDEVVTMKGKQVCVLKVSFRVSELEKLTSVVKRVERETKARKN